MSLDWVDTTYNFSFLRVNSKADIYVDEVFEKILMLSSSDLYNYFAKTVFENKDDNLAEYNIRNYIRDNYSEDDEKIEELKKIIEKILNIMYNYVITKSSPDEFNVVRDEEIFEKIEQFSYYLRSEYTNIESINKSRKYINQLKDEIKEIQLQKEEIINRVNLSTDYVKQLKSEIEMIEDEKVKMIELFFKEFEEKKIEMVQTTDEFIKINNNNFDRIKEDVNKVKKDVYKEIIAVVGIFTAISFGAFGGMSLLNELFTNSGKLLLNDIIILGCISGIFILTLVYIIIDYLSKLIGIKIENIDDKKCRFYNFRRNHMPLYYSYVFISMILAISCFCKYKK
ncbi:hypothetical protein GOD97_05135 [Paeniclostridium sordellii]|uniref:hypothetical protein n=1 Tax=Paraclostridium sordellii TaxID=1505 RepID=UPI0012ED1A2B|nr:hypothetical protein [Paeniclostridium sordellii]MVO74115.1 hypothetical protein [Paeniclostridium sordellii]